VKRDTNISYHAGAGSASGIAGQDPQACNYPSQVH
jgi:hypothetical protein